MFKYKFKFQINDEKKKCRFNIWAALVHEIVILNINETEHFKYILY